MTSVSSPHGSSFSIQTVENRSLCYRNVTEGSPQDNELSEYLNFLFV